MKHLLIIGLSLSIGLSCSAVSRIGGGKINSALSGFTMEFDPTYKLTDIANGVRATGDNTFVPGFGITSSFFEVSEFSHEFPQYTSVNREDLRKQMIALGWEETSTSQPCALAVKKASSNVIAVIVTWGGGKGFVIKGLHSWNADKVLDDALNTLSFVDGNCAWK